MKFNRWIMFGALALLGGIMGDAMAQDGEKPDPKLVGYAIGQQFGSMLVDGKDVFDLNELILGMKDRLEDKDAKYEDDTLQSAFRAFQQMLTQRQQEEQAKATAGMKEAGEQFLAENAKRDGVTVLESGLQYEVLASGTGATPTKSDTVEAYYKGTFVDGSEFDSSQRPGNPASFPVNRVIMGWTEALQLMKVGDKWKLYIPYYLAYGDRGSPPRIPGFSALVFEIELMGVK
jgi:FKBP-type peptidyl-prolyl cis-trans isomerase FklB